MNGDPNLHSSRGIDKIWKCQSAGTNAGKMRKNIAGIGLGLELLFYPTLLHFMQHGDILDVHIAR